MTIQTSPYALPTLATASGPRTALAATSATSPEATLSAAEQAEIASAFPAQPEVAHRLYGASREVQAPPQLGARLDLSA
ncbi:MAG: hypothetical protein AAF845_01765 [Bacteroidota bacterium]